MVLIFSTDPVRTPIGLVGLILGLLSGAISGRQAKPSSTRGNDRRERTYFYQYRQNDSYSQSEYYQPTYGSRVHEEARRAREDATRRYREEATRRQRASQSPPGSNNGQPTDMKLEQTRRHIELLLRKADRTSYPAEAAACRAKVENLRRKYGL